MQQAGRLHSHMHADIILRIYVTMQLMIDIAKDTYNNYIAYLAIYHHNCKTQK